MDKKDIDRQIEKNCMQYFRGSLVWEKIFNGFREKYRSYGYFTGTVILKNISSDEIDALEGFFGKNFHGQKSVSVSAAKFAKALSSSRYSSISPERVLELYFGDTVRGRKEEQEEEARVRAAIIKDWADHCAGTPAADPDNAAYIQSILSSFRNDLKKWRKLMLLCALMFNRLPYRIGERRYLAVFAADITSDPHAFDVDRPEGKLLYKLIQYDLEKRGIDLPDTGLFPAYRKQRSYLEAGIMVDDVSNYAMLYGVKAFKKNGVIHSGMEGFFCEHEMVQVPLAVIAGWARIECPQNKIYIVENPSVYAMLCSDECGTADDGGIYHLGDMTAYMCMNGQPRLAGLMVLELLARSGTTVYYAGDIDPEGLLIAQKLSRFYDGKFNFWHMDAEDYIKSRSSEKISYRRLKTLEKITDERLMPAARMIMKYKTAGYQERIVYK